MRVFSSLCTFLDFVFRRSRVEQEMEEEFRSHLRIRAQDLERQGLSRAEAERHARIEFGAYQRYKEECREALGTRLLGELIADVRYGLRQLRRNPGFTIVAVLTLTLGIGANTAIFTLVDGMVLRPLPAAHPGQLVQIEYKTPEGSGRWISYPDYNDLRQQASDFSGFLVWARESRFLNSMDESSQILIDIVSPDYFTTLGVHAFRGRPFLPEMDSGTPRERTVVISYRAWKTRLGGDPNIVGKTVKLTGEPTVVLGIAPPGFHGLVRFGPSDAWVLASQGEPDALQPRGALFFEAMGRLKPGVTIAQARAQLDTIGRCLAAAYPATNKATTFILQTQEQELSGELPYLLLPLSLAGLVLLIACANLAGLLLARGETRRRELAIRAALGAGRMRVARQLVTEGFLLSIAGAGLGLLITRWFISAEPALMPPGPIQMGPILGVDGRLLLFTVAVSLIATLAFSLTPALQGIRIRPFAVLKGEESGLRRAGRRIPLRSILVMGQIAVSVVMLTAAMLLVRSLNYTMHVPLGFDLNRHLLVVNVFPTKNVSGRSFLPGLAENLGGLPGVERATCALRILLSGAEGGAAVPVSIPGVRLPGGEPTTSIMYNSVCPGYFGTVGTRILTGRSLRLGDGPQSQKVVIVSEAMAKRFWPKGDAIGHSLKVAGTDFQIVGIAEDAKINDIHELPEPYLYFPIEQTPRAAGALILETRIDPRALVPAVKAEIRKTDPTIAIWEVDTSRELLRFATWDDAMVAKVAVALSALGIFLAAIGLYGVISYLVTQRTHEIGIRMALGARAADVLATVLRQGLRLAAVGAAAGAAAAFALTHLMASELYGVSPHDPLSFIGAVLIVVAISALACYIPARRATKVDPMVTLRYE
jgi:putative ABC transport system permease protein